MTDQEKDKLIVEAFGECWHDAEGELRSHIWPTCSKCGEPHTKWPKIANQNLVTPDGFFWWWKRAQKMEWWDDFIRNFTYHDYLINLVDFTRGRDDLYKFLMERSIWR